jgi:hypothetical protein
VTDDGSSRRLPGISYPRQHPCEARGSLECL